MKNLVWTEKYRPKEMDTFISSGIDKESIMKWIKNPMELPHLLLVSRSPGTGKTSLAFIIRNEIGLSKSDFLILNSSDDRKIETIRGKVKDFAIAMRRDKDKPKIILMDEADGMLEATQNALRTIMELYSSNCRFILTANHEEKIIEPIKSRCVIIRFGELDKGEIADRLDQIMKIEGCNCDDEAFERIIDTYYPDMRRMINKMQEMAPDITMKNFSRALDIEEQFYNILMENKYLEARQFMIKHNIDARYLLKFTLEKLLKDDRFLRATKKELFWLGADYDYRMSMGADPEIQMFAFILKFCNMTKKE